MGVDEGLKKIVVKGKLWLVFNLKLGHGEILGRLYKKFKMKNWIEKWDKAAFGWSWMELESG